LKLSQKESWEEFRELPELKLFI